MSSLKQEKTLLEGIQNQSAKNEKLKHLVFWPPFLLLAGVVIASFVNFKAFSAVMNAAVGWVFLNLGWLFQSGSMILVFVLIYVYFSPLGKIKIGGPDAIPLLSHFQWWAVTLCTGIAVGVLFFGTAEPVYHVSAPPTSLGINPFSPESAIFAMSTAYLHWSFTAYAIYTLPSILFAFVYYNMKNPFSISSTLYPLMGERCYGRFGQLVDAACLFFIAAGMAASVGNGTLSIGGGLENLFGIKSGPVSWGIITLVIVATFVFSSITGLSKGVKWLSDINAKIFLGILVFVAVVGPTAYCLNLGTEGLGSYLGDFFQKSMFTGAAAGDTWAQWWTIFYWASYYVWAPVSAVFFGRIGYGYTIRQFIVTNFVLPSFFAIAWFTFFSGSTIHMMLVEKIGLAQIMADKGVEGLAYAFFSNYPLAMITIPLFIFTMFLSIVTGSDAMTSSMGGLCSTGISPDSPEPKSWLKILWGVLIGLIGWVMLSFRGLDGLKMTDIFAGSLAIFLIIAMAFSLVKVARNPKAYDQF